MAGRRIPAAMVLGLLTVAGGSVFLSIHGNTFPTTPPPVAAVSVPPLPVPRPTLAKFQAVREGMTKADVVELLGPPSTTYERSAGLSRSAGYTWDIRQPDFNGSVSVFIENYRVVSKSQWSLR